MLDEMFKLFSSIFLRIFYVLEFVVYILDLLVIKIGRNFCFFVVFVSFYCRKKMVNVD